MFVEYNVNFGMVLGFFFRFIDQLYSLYRRGTYLGRLATCLIKYNEGATFRGVEGLRGGTFGLRQSCTVSQQLGGVICATCVPGVSVLIAPDNVTHVMRAIVPDIGNFFFIGVVFLGRSTKYFLINSCGGFTGLAY